MKCMFGNSNIEFHVTYCLQAEPQVCTGLKEDKNIVWFYTQHYSSTGDLSIFLRTNTFPVLRPKRSENWTNYY